MIARGDTVIVTEPGIRPWAGTVLSVKPSPKTGTWVEVRDHRDGATWAIPEANHGQLQVIHEKQ